MKGVDVLRVQSEKFKLDCKAFAALVGLTQVGGKSQGIAAEVLEVLGEAAAAIEPRQGTLDNPAHRQHNEAAGVV